MSFLHVNYSEIDTQISQFARVIALPIRVFIIRMIVENGNSLSKNALYTSAFSASTINKHIQELKTLGIIKIKVVKSQVTYGVDMVLFNQMSTRFNTFFDNANPNQVVQHPDNQASPSPGPEKDIEMQQVPFGLYVKELRQEINMSQATLSAKINVDRGELSRIECCKRDLPADKLPMLSKALYVDLEILQEAYTEGYFHK